MITETIKKCHNPYFSRWFSAIEYVVMNIIDIDDVTILILVDGFLQFISLQARKKRRKVTILILVDGFLQFDSLN